MMKRSTAAALGILLGLSYSTAHALVVPESMHIQGVLAGGNGSDTPEGPTSFTFRFFDEPDDGANELWSADQTLQVLVGGFFVGQIGTKERPLDYSVFDSDTPVYLEITVDGDRLVPRHRINSVPYAMWAANALDEEEIASALGDRLVPNACADGQIAMWDAASAVWVCADQAAGPQGAAGADGTSVTVAIEEAGSNCPEGGLVVTDASGTSYVCNGADGADGADGASVSAAVEAAGANCPNGGVSITDAGGTTYVCNGANGADGANGTNGSDGSNGSDGADGTSVTTAVEAPGGNCPNGGVSVMDAGGTTYVCNGADGAQGQQGDPGAPGPAGPGGGGVTVKEAGGATLGTVIDVNASTFTFMTSTSYFVTLSHTGGIPHSYYVYYPNANCTGSPTYVNGGYAGEAGEFTQYRDIFARVAHYLGASGQWAVPRDTGGGLNMGVLGGNLTTASGYHPGNSTPCGAGGIPTSNWGNELVAISPAALGLPATITPPFTFE